MAYRIHPFPMTFSDLRGYSTISCLFKCDFFVQSCSSWQDFGSRSLCDSWDSCNFYARRRPQRQCEISGASCAGDAGNASPAIIGQPATKCLISPRSLSKLLSNSLQNWRVRCKQSLRYKQDTDRVFILHALW